jgi:hypothetical protein
MKEFKNNTVVGFLAGIVAAMLLSTSGQEVSRTVAKRLPKRLLQSPP